MIARLIKNGNTIATLEDSGKWTADDPVLEDVLNRICVPERTQLPFGIEEGAFAAALLSCQVAFEPAEDMAGSNVVH